jgi:hypothetical protein
MNTTMNAKRKGRPPHDIPPPRPMVWESAGVAKAVQDILDALEVPPIDPASRYRLQRLFYIHDKFGDGDARGYITLLIRTILESENNQDALVEPIIHAVSSSMKPEWTNLGLAWIEAFDKIPLNALLQTMRSLDLFAEKNLGYYLGISISNKLRPILQPLVPKPAPPVRAKRKRPTKALKRRKAAQPLRRMAA